MRGDSIGPVSGRRALLTVAALGMTLHGIILTLSGPLLPSLMHDFGLQEARAGILLATGSAGFLMGTLASGFFVDHRGLKEAYLLGQGVEAVALALYGVAPTFVSALGAALLLGLGMGFIETTLNTLPAHISGQQAGSLMNVIHLFFSLGAFASPLIVGPLLQTGWAWRSIYRLTALPALAMGLVVLRLRFPRAGAEAVAQGGQSTARDTSTWALLRERPVILGALVLLFYVGGELGIGAWVVLYLQRQLQLSIGLASAGLSTFWIAMMVGRYWNSRLALRFSTRSLMIASGAGGAVACWGLLTTQYALMAFGWLSLAGLLSAGVYPLAMASVNSRYPRHAGRVSGVLASCAATGSLLFPPLLGAVAQGTSLRIAMSLNGFWMAAVALTFFFMPREQAAARLSVEIGK